MHPKVWYRSDFHPETLLSQSFAAAGVIAAMDRPPLVSDLVGALQDRLRLNIPIPWKHPRSNPEWLADVLSADDLARAWSSAIEIVPIDDRLQVRLVSFAVDPATLEPSSAIPTIETIVDINSRLAVSRSTSGPSARVLTGVNFNAALPAWAHRWRWPLNVAVTGVKQAALLHELETIEAIDRFRFAMPRIWRRDVGASDILFVPKNRALALGQLALQAAGLVVAYGEGNQFDEPLKDLALGIEPFPGPVSTPMVVLPIGRDQLGIWLNEFLLNVGNNLSLDTAIYGAFSALTKADGLPLLFGPTSYLANMRLENRLSDSVERLDRLPDQRRLSLDENDLAMIGVKPGSKLVGAVRSDLRKIIDERTSASVFDRERMIASDIVKLSEAIEKVEVNVARESEEPEISFGDKRVGVEGPTVETPMQERQESAREVPSFSREGEAELTQPRYTVLEVMSKGASPEQIVEPLTTGSAYQLQICIDTKPGGVSVVGTPSEIRSWPQTEVVNVDVVINPEDESDWEIGDQVLRLALPPQGCSQKIKTTIVAKMNGKAAGRRSLFVRLYYKLNLIDSIEFSPFVRPMSLKQTQPLPADNKPSLFMEYRHEAGRLDPIDLHIEPRQVSISIRRHKNEWRMAFALATDGADIDLVGYLALTDIAQADLIAEVRGVWGEIVTSPDLYGVTRRREFLASAMTKIACVGRKAWLAMFGATAGGVSKTMQKIGQILRDTPPQKNAVLQITFEDRNIGLMFPWTLIFPGSEAKPPPDAISIERFWGHRFIIEQRTLFQNLSPVFLGNGNGEAVTVGFAAYKQFKEVASQQVYLESLTTKMKGRLSVTSRIDDRDALFENLKNDSLDILYFFAHGYSRNPGMTNINYFTDWVNAELPKLEGVAKGAMVALVDNIREYKGDNTGDWIKLSDSTIRLDELAGESIELNRSPVVFLNMCHSAQMNPGLYDGFVAYFLGCGARAVLGTECPIPSQFADEFAKHFFDALARGANLGEAVNEARRAFDTEGNPLGLAYSLYGSASTRITNARMPILPSTSSALST